MRVSSNTIPENLLNHLSRISSRQLNLQDQVASGQRVAMPSDDPQAMGRYLELRTEGKQLGQYQKNIERQQELASMTFSAVQALSKISDRAGEIAVLADSLTEPDQYDVFAREVTAMIEEAVQVLGAKHRGDYLFSGTATDTPPFSITKDATGDVTAVLYQGNTDVPESEIADGVAFSAQVVGVNNSGTGPGGVIQDSRTGGDFFTHLISLQNHLRAHDYASINNVDAPNLALDEENLILHLSNNGNLQAQLETTRSIGSDRIQAIEGLASDEINVDLAEAIMKLKQTQTAYQAALQSAGVVLNSSLLDFLR